jgi:biopolymer transport protein ExbD
MQPSEHEHDPRHQPEGDPAPASQQDDETPGHRVHQWRGHARLSLNLTAMIDVVFLLMIYFMVATEFKSGEEIYRLDLPERIASTAQRDPFDLDYEPVRIHVSSIGSADRSYRLRIEGPYEQPGTFEELHEFLDARRMTPETMTGLFEPDHPIVVVPSRTARWEHAIEAFNAAARARYRNITFGVAQ